MVETPNTIHHLTRYTLISHTHSHQNQHIHNNQRNLRVLHLIARLRYAIYIKQEICLYLLQV